MQTLRNAVMSLVVLTILTGIIYPLVITGIAQAVFPARANGSIIVKNGTPVGSEFIGQQFGSPKYFWGRPSATTPYPYNGQSSSGSNMGTNNPALMENVQARIAALHAADPGNTEKIPVDLVTASASGLDPEISPAAAEYQAARVARARGIDISQVNSLIQADTKGRLLGIFGEPRVNVLKLNLALDELNK
ncbi:MAG: potassium-transporting ATPase subunit KdpC [Nitrospiraceae bacterium]|nr:potassium-transporting ATPase subunit KdpC [Nitrospiraceae bacterium]